MNDTAPAQRYFDYATFLRRRYGEVLHRVPLDLAFGCPHRDADGSGGGCIFCGERDGRAIDLGPALPLRDQVARGVALACERYRATGFMAYFRAHTSTHAPLERLRPLIEETLSYAAFRAVIISTRPDCLPADIVDYLGELAARVDVWVELGIQTANDATLRRIDRGHDFAAATAAVNALTARGIHVAAHVILGLPGEGPDDFAATADALAALDLRGIKIHNLHILKGTPLAAMWAQGAATAWDEHEYGEVLMAFLRRIPAHWPIMRLVTDTPNERLLAPHWWLSKGEFLEYIDRQMQQRDWRQGDLCPQPAAAPEAAAAPPPSRPPASSTAMPRGMPGAPARERTVRLPQPPAVRRKPQTLPTAARVLVRAADLRERLAHGHVTLLDIGFGLGSALLGAIDAARAGRAPHQLRAVALGIDSDTLATMEQPLLRRGLDTTQHASAGSAENSTCRLSLYWGDPRRQVFRMRGRAHVIVIEPRDVTAFPELFTYDFARRLSALLSADGVLVAATGDKAFRHALRRVGLRVGVCSRCGPLSGGGTMAAWDSALIREPLKASERLAMTRTLAGIPYRDALLVWPRERILRHRAEVMARLRNRSWRRWLGRQP